MIHRALKLLRKYHGLKQKDLASRLNISPSFLSEIEKGTKTVSYEMLESYAAVFDIPVSSIAMFSEISQGAGDSDSLKARITRKAVQLLEWLDATSEFHDDSNKK